MPADVSRKLRRIGRLSGVSALLSLLFTRSASAGPLDVLDWTAAPFLTLYIALSVAALTGILALPRIVGRGHRETRRRGALESVEVALLLGGFRRAADVMALEGIATVDPLLARKDAEAALQKRRT